MESLREASNHRFESQHSRRLTAGVLILAPLILLSCSRPSPTPPANPSSSPGTPVVQVSPNASSAELAKADSARKTFKAGEVVPAGYLGYKVYGSWFTDHLSSQGPAAKTTGSFLYVDLSVVNTDKKERPVGPFKLIDEKGEEIGLSERGATVEQSVGQIAKLAPNTSKRAFAIFAVPGGHQYKLRIRGFTDEDAVLIELSPAATPPAK